MIGRTYDKMENVKKLLEQYNIKTKIIVKDFFECSDSKFWDTLENDLYDILNKSSILINNVGLYKSWDKYIQST